MTATERNRIRENDIKALRAHTAERIAEWKAGCGSDHQMEDLEVFSCEGEFDIVRQRCVRCGHEGTTSAVCVHKPSIGTPLVERW